MTIPLTFRPIDQWPDGWRGRKDRKPNPFKAGYTDTLERLQAELDHLDATAVHLQVDADPGQVRLDGQLRASAKVNHPGVILTIATRRLGTLVYPCDTFERRWSGEPPSWQINLRAIALGLEALRKVDRYGIASAGQQYSGWAALPAASSVTTAQVASGLLAAAAGITLGEGEVLNAGRARDAWRTAAKAHHPDAGGDPDTFRTLTEAMQILVGGSP